MKPVAILDGWLPFPDEVLRALRWEEGDLLALEIIDDTLIVTKHPQPQESHARQLPTPR